MINDADWPNKTEDITHSLYQFSMRFTSELISGISWVLQKVFKYLNGTIISTLIVPMLPVWAVIFSLNLNELVVLSLIKSTTATVLSKAGSS